MGCECGNKAFVEVELSVPAIESKWSAEKVRMALEEITAVRGVRVRVPGKTALVSFDDTLIGLQQLKDALKRAGFPADLA